MIKFKVGDLIYNKKDHIVFLIIEKNRNRFTLEYIDHTNGKAGQFGISKSQLEHQFATRPQDLEHFKVIVK
jgi:hypothetical protein